MSGVISQLTQRHPELIAPLKLCASSTKAMAAAFFPEQFKRPFSSMHDPIFELIDDPEEKKTVIAAPRSTGKTTLIGIAFASRQLLFGLSRFIVYVSNSYAKAEMMTENLKHALTHNPKIDKIFGKQRTKSWSKDGFTLQNGARVVPLGADQSPRGLNFRGQRPDCFILDDVETTELVRNDVRRDQLYTKFLADVQGAVDIGSNRWKLIVIGTILHQDSFLMRLIQDPKWKSTVTQLCDDNYKSTWPEFISDAEIKEMADDYRRQGNLETFFMEYRNMPVGGELATFKSSFFNRYSETSYDFQSRVDKLTSMVIIDPAKTVHRHSADSAIIGIAFDVGRQRLYVRDLILGKLYPEQIQKAAIEMARRINAYVIGLEVTSLHEWATRPFKTAMVEEKWGGELIELNARGKKEDRVGALLPFYRKGQIWHNEKVCDALESQLMSYPRAAKWDAMDALAYFVVLMDKRNKVFFPDEEPDVMSADERRVINELMNRKESRWDTALGSMSP